MSESKSALIASAIAGDREAVACVLEHFGPLVRGELYIGKQWQSLLSIDDVMQVTYIEVFLRIEQLPSSGDEAFHSWLRRVADNNLRDAIRELGRGKRPPPAKRIGAPSSDSCVMDLLEGLGATTNTPSSVAQLREAESMIEAAIKQLPKDYATVVRLYYSEGRSGVDVGVAMGRSRGAVVMLRSRALDRLRELLGASTCFFGK